MSHVRASAWIALLCAIVAIVGCEVHRSLDQQWWDLAYQPIESLPEPSTGGGVLDDRRPSYGFDGGTRERFGEYTLVRSVSGRVLLFDRNGRAMWAGHEAWPLNVEGRNGGLLLARIWERSIYSHPSMMYRASRLDYSREPVVLQELPYELMPAFIVSREPVLDIDGDGSDEFWHVVPLVEERDELQILGVSPSMRSIRWRVEVWSIRRGVHAGRLFPLTEAERESERTDRCMYSVAEIDIPPMLWASHVELVRLPGDAVVRLESRSHYDWDMPATPFATLRFDTQENQWISTAVAPGK